MTLLTIANWVCAVGLVVWGIVSRRRLAEARRTIAGVRAHCLNRYWAADGRRPDDPAVERLAHEVLDIIDADHE